MIRHYAMVRLLPEVDAEERSRLMHSMASLCEAVPSVRSYEVSEDAGLVRGNHDLLVVAGFDDEEGLRAYLGHPDHQAFLATELAPRMRGVAVFQGVEPAAGASAE